MPKASLQETVNQLRVQLAALQTEVDNVAAQLLAAQALHESDQAIIGTLRARVVELEERIVELEAQLSPPPPPPPSIIPADYNRICLEEFRTLTVSGTATSSSKKFDVLDESAFYPGPDGDKDVKHITPTGIRPLPFGDFDVEADARGLFVDGYGAAIEIAKGHNPIGSNAPGSLSTKAAFGKHGGMLAVWRFGLSRNYIHWNGSKIGYGRGVGTQPYFLSLLPIGPYTSQLEAIERPIKLRIGLQNVIPRPGTTSATWNADSPDAFTLERGRMNEIAVLTERNTPGLADGLLRVTLNGNVIIDRRDVGWFQPGAEHVFTGVQWTPTHDDFQSTDDYDFSVYQYVDRLELYGKDIP